jgi:hypothetical protein
MDPPTDKSETKSEDQPKMQESLSKEKKDRKEKKTKKSKEKKDKKEKKPVEEKASENQLVTPVVTEPNKTEEESPNTTEKDPANIPEKVTRFLQIFTRMTSITASRTNLTQKKLRNLLETQKPKWILKLRGIRRCPSESHLPTNVNQEGDTQTKQEDETSKQEEKVMHHRTIG